MALVSIVMPAYNAEKYLAEAIMSVQQQTFTNWELIVVNDGSNDTTQTIAEKFSREDSRIKVINQPNKRLGGARNTGIKNSTGKWVGFLDADDLWTPAKLEKQMLAAANVPEADVIFTGGWLFFNDDITNTQPYQTVHGKFGGKEMYLLEYNTNYIPVLSVIVKKGMVDTVGEQYETFAQGCEDWDYWLRMARAGAIFFGIDEKLFFYRRHDSNMSGNQTNMKLAQASVFIRNFDAGVFSKEQGKKIFDPLINPLIVSLVCAGRKPDADYIYREFQKISPSPLNTINYFLIKNLKYRWWHIVKARRYLKKMTGNVLSLFSLKRRRALQEQVFPENGNITVRQNFSIGKYKSIRVQGGQCAITIGQNVTFREFCNITVEGKGELTIGDNAFFNNYCSINCLGNIIIGADTLFGEGVKIYDHNHLYNYTQKSGLRVDKVNFDTGKVKIGNNCWVGSSVTILNNVEIGDNVIIGAGNLIYKSIPSNCIVKANAGFSIEQK